SCAARAQDGHDAHAGGWCARTAAAHTGDSGRPARMSACDRLLELAPQIQAEQGPNVQALWREYVAVFLECNGHPEDLTTNSKDIHDLATEIVGKLDNPFITVDDTDLQIGAIISGRESVCTDPSKSTVHRGADPVMSFNGQF